MSERNHIKKAISLPPGEIWRKANRRLENYTKRSLGHLRAKWFDTQISEEEFLRALDDRFTNLESFLNHLVVREKPLFFLDLVDRCETGATVKACQDTDAGSLVDSRMGDHVSSRATKETNQ